MIEEARKLAERKRSGLAYAYGNGDAEGADMLDALADELEAKTKGNRLVCEMMSEQSRHIEALAALALDAYAAGWIPWRNR